MKYMKFTLKQNRTWRFLAYILQMAFASKKAQYELAREIDGDHEGSDQQRGMQLLHRQSRRAEEAAAIINQQNLHDSNSRHNQDEQRILPQMRQQIDAVGACIKAVEYPGKDEYREKGRHEIHRVAAVAEQQLDIRQL